MVGGLSGWIEKDRKGVRHMDTIEQKSFITDIARRQKKDVKDTLYELISLKNIFIGIENTKFQNGFERSNSNFIDLPLHRDNLYCIYSKGFWSGNSIKVAVSIQVGEDEWDTDYRDFLFNTELTITVDDLFIFEEKDEVQTLELPKSSQKEEANTLLLVGVLLDILIDKPGKRIMSLEKERIFKTQTDLINYIEKYDMYGLKRASLESKFSKANAELKNKIDSENPN